MSSTPAPAQPVFNTATIVVPSIFKRVETYVAQESHRLIAYITAEAGALLTLAHVSATTLEHEITVAGAAVIAAAINRARAKHLIP